MPLREVLLVGVEDLDAVQHLLVDRETRDILRKQAERRTVCFCTNDILCKIEETSKPYHRFIINELADKGVDHLLLGGSWVLGDNK